jgi:hypothetical protein
MTTQAHIVASAHHIQIKAILTSLPHTCSTPLLCFVPSHRPHHISVCICLYQLYSFSEKKTINCIVVGRTALWSNGQSSWLQIQRSGLDSRHYQIIWDLVGLERGPLSLVSTTEELLGRNSSGSGLENRDYVRRDPSR